MQSVRENPEAYDRGDLWWQHGPPRVITAWSCIQEWQPSSAAGTTRTLSEGSRLRPAIASRWPQAATSGKLSASVEVKREVVDRPK